MERMSKVSHHVIAAYRVVGGVVVVGEMSVNLEGRVRWGCGDRDWRCSI
jgi:hypothetical protein